MPIRITGMNSGLDTEALVSELVSAYRLKSQKYTKAQTKLSWKQDAWKSLNSKISTFYSKLTGLKYSSGYTTKKATVSDSTKASVSANSNAVNGTYSVKIDQTAKAGYLTGTELGANITESSTLASLGFSDYGMISLNVEGKTTNISVNGSTKISDFVKSLNDAGVTANFDSKYKRIYVSAKKTGVENDFTLSGVNIAGNDALAKLGLNVDSSSVTDTYRTWASYAMNSDGQNYESGNPFVTGYDSDGKPITNGTYSKEKTWKRIAEILAEKGQKSAEITKNEANIKYAEAYRKVNDPSADKTTQDYQDALAIVNGDTTDIDVTAIQNAHAAGTLNSYITDRQNEIASAQEFLDRHSLLDTSVSSVYEMEEKISGAIDILNDTTEVSRGAIRVKGQDAKIVVNGAVYTSDSNEFDINGLSITALAEAASEFSVTVGTDTQGLYDKIKDIIKEYNTLINEMTKLYNADSAKGYEPLTTEEKDSLSETEIKEWETKIKDSLLRRDDTLSSILSSMKNVMFSSYTVNGKSYSLSSFGIMTLGVMKAPDNEENAFHIDGDADDPITSANTDKLMAAIKDDPDAVVDFFKQLATGLYDTINSRMSSSTLSSYGSVYNDKQMAQEYSDYTTTIKKWDQKLKDIEESYYKKFAAMESALASLQSQQSALAGMFGF